MVIFEYFEFLEACSFPNYAYSALGTGVGAFLTADKEWEDWS